MWNDYIKLMEGDMSIPECVDRLPGCDEPCKKTNLLDTLSIMKDYVDTYLKTITFDKLADTDISGSLSDILYMVLAHIEDMKRQDRQIH
jgi:hypothetical protein